MSTPAKPSPDERAEKLADDIGTAATGGFHYDHEAVRPYAAALLQAEEALAGAMIGMNGGSDNAFCHNGICSRAVCVQCQRKDAVSVALATIRELIGREEGA